MWLAIGIGRASAFTCNQDLLGSREATSWGCPAVRDGDAPSKMRS